MTRPRLLVNGIEISTPDMEWMLGWLEETKQAMQTIVSEPDLVRDGVIDTSPCPCCDEDRIGAPRPTLDGALSSSYAGPLAWKNRLDLREWVCARCDKELGPDTVRTKLLQLLP